MRNPFWLAPLLLLILSPLARSGEVRELNADRPDKTESPWSVPKGYFQLETDVVTYTRDRKIDGEKTSAYTVGATNFKYGFTPSTDIQVILETYTHQKVETSESSRVRQGYGDTTIRLKQNLADPDDHREVAMGVMPFVKIPTGDGKFGTKRPEYGIIVPISVNLPLGFDLEAMLQINKDMSADEVNYHTKIIHAFSIGHEIYGPLSGYGELYTQSTNEDGSGLVATLDWGLLYKIGANLQLDAGVNLGVTEAADDINPFLGFTFRF